MPMPHLQTISYQPAGMIQLKPGERALLAELAPLAACKAADFARVYCRALLEKWDLTSLTPEQYSDLLCRAEKWFVGLFVMQARLEVTLFEDRDSQQQPVLGVRLADLRELIPLVLKMGRWVTGHSRAPERAMTAFWKSLSLDLAISLAIGETAPLVVIGASTFIQFDPEGPFSKFTTLPI